MNNRAIYRFGPFRLDPARCTLQRRDEQIQLPPKVFKCLVHLLDNRDRVVSRDGLLNAIWGTEHLSPGVVAQTVLQVRQALGDTGEAQLYIKTVRGFGYRWTAPVEIDEPAQAQVHAPKQAPAMVDARVALLLPLTVSAAAEDGWVRLGVMDFINERLRAAGLSMVSSDTVISLLAGHVGEPDEGQLDRLSSATGAHVLLAAQAIRQGTRWIVSVRTINGAHAALTTAGEAHDVIEAARFASDRMADVLGLSPTDEADKEPEPQRLAQQVQAAHLAGEVGDARALLDKASAKLREHPDIRFSLGHVELLSGHYEAAQRILEGLLPRSGGQDSASTAFQAKVLNALSYVHLARSSDWTLAESFARRALALLGERVAPVWAGAARLHLGIMVMRRGDTAAASVHFTLARWIFHRNGQLFGLAATDEAAGDLESLHERPATALRHYRSAVERYSALGRRAEELRARAAALTAHLDLLDREAAAALAPRLRELAARVDAPSYLAFFKDAQARLEIANGRPGAARAAAAPPAAARVAPVRARRCRSLPCPCGRSGSAA